MPDAKSTAVAAAIGAVLIGFYAWRSGLPVKTFLFVGAVVGGTVQILVRLLGVS